MTKSCAHDVCTCEHEEREMIARDGQLFCNNHCADERDADRCDCGHPGCRG